ncbi:hypothetical protein [Thermococcus eurythermalis]|uniref:hypothetical protein n=1 Tax=Thermococcus eurythermalis TaxID=1505907 RepID=UPI000679AE07|nr:hypothetical protein [Thermococcus eurythermalis]
MERLGLPRRKRENRIDFLRDLISSLLVREDLYSSEALFKDAVEEVYSLLKSEVLSGNSKLLDAYETAVVLRAVAFKENLEVEALLRKLLSQLG